MLTKANHIGSFIFFFTKSHGCTWHEHCWQVQGGLGSKMTMLWTWHHPNWKVECGQQKEDADQMHMSEQVLGLSWCTVMNCQEKPMLNRYMIVGGQSDNPCQWIYTGDMNGLFPPQAAILLWLVKKVMSAILMVLTTTVLGVISPKEVGESCDQNQEQDESETDRLFSMRYGTRQEPHNCPWIQVRCDRYTKWQRAPPIQARPRSSPGHSPDNPAPLPLLFERDC